MCAQTDAKNQSKVPILDANEISSTSDIGMVESL